MLSEIDRISVALADIRERLPLIGQWETTRGDVIIKYHKALSSKIRPYSIDVGTETAARIIQSSLGFLPSSSPIIYIDSSPPPQNEGIPIVGRMETEVYWKPMQIRLFTEALYDMYQEARAKFLDTSPNEETAKKYAEELTRKMIVEAISHEAFHFDHMFINRHALTLASLDPNWEELCREYIKISTYYTPEEIYCKMHSTKVAQDVNLTEGITFRERV